jgi:hypothetical protein
MQSRKWIWLIALVLLGAPGCGGDDDDSGGEGEGEMDAVLDILVDGAEGVLNGVRSAKASYLESNSTSCDGLTSRRVTPAEFPNRRAPEVQEWNGLGNPHVEAEIANGSTQVLIETFESTDGTGEPTAAGCEDPVYVAPGQTLHTTITVRLNP